MSRLIFTALFSLLLLAPSFAGAGKIDVIAVSVTGQGGATADSVEVAVRKAAAKCSSTSKGVRDKGHCSAFLVKAPHGQYLVGGVCTIGKGTTKFPTYGASKASFPAAIIVAKKKTLSLLRKNAKISFRMSSLNCEITIRMRKGRVL